MKSAGDSKGKPAQARSVTSPKSKVLLVDDHPIVREGLSRVIQQETDLTVCGEAENSQQAMQIIETASPNIAIIDISLAESHGLELVKMLKATYPELPVLMLSMHDESLYAERALRAGAKGYIMKQEPPAELIRAIRRVLRGEIYVSQSFAGQMLTKLTGGQSQTAASPVDQLSDRELEVLTLLGQGRKTSQIAHDLRLSIKTVETYREHIKEKLELKDATSLMRYAVQWVDSQHQA
jgi:DNA-binding NarL/FixJ family response regulator